MKTIVLGDIHGYTAWKDILKNEPEFDRVIFIGDYVDSFDRSGKEQMDNLLDIISYAKQEDVDPADQKEVILLIGNHDFHYFPGVINPCSGYQPLMRPLFESVYQDNYVLFQTAFIDENNYIYSHAGITKTWLDHLGLRQTWYDRDNIDTTQARELVSWINSTMVRNPRFFYFYDDDLGGYGNHVAQSPIWVRPQSLAKDGIDAVQIVGHTRPEYGRIDPGKCERQGFWTIDALDGKYKDYLFIDNGNIQVHTLTIE